jgi:phospholipid N-methyltransferase
MVADASVFFALWLQRQLRIVGREVARVWSNLPPAQIWCYWGIRRAPDSGVAI